MEEKNANKTTAIGIDELWIVLKAVVGFSIIRILTSGTKMLPGIYGEILSVVLFTGWIYLNFKRVAKNEGYTLAECRVTKPKISLRDIMFVFCFLFLQYWIISLSAERIIYTGQSMFEIISLSMSKILKSGIGSGLNEEVVFRGYLLKSLEDKIGIKKAILLSSFVFGIMHILNGNMTLWMMIWVSIGAGSLGAMFAVLTYETGSIWRAVLMHAACNLSSLVVGYEMGNRLLVMNLSGGITNEKIFCMSYAVSSALCMIVILGYWVRRRNLAKKHS